MNTFGRVFPEELIPKQKRDALHAITLIKEKIYGKNKRRGCADGISQRRYITKEEAAETKFSMKALLAQLMIDVFEERAMEIFDVPGAYLNPIIPEDKFVLLKLEDEFVDIMCEVNSEFIKDFQQEFNKRYYIKGR